MKLKLHHLLLVVYFVLLFVVVKVFNIYSIVFFLAVLYLDFATKIRSEHLILLYFLSALSAVPPLFFVFVMFLPFAVFGLLLEERNFIRDYLIGFALSYIPATIIYLVSTYFSLPLSIPALFFIFYSVPVLVVLLLRKKALTPFRMESKELIYALIALFFTLTVAINLLSDSALFTANGSREFYRTQLAVDGFESTGVIPLLDPGVGNAEATYLWVTPTFAVHSALSNIFIDLGSKILSYNARSLFMLYLFVLSLYVLFISIIGRRSTITVLAMTAVGVLIGLNFVVLHYLESIKGFSAYPLANLFFSLILLNPKTFRHFALLMTVGPLIPLIHPGFGTASIIFGGFLFLFTKKYYLKDRTELKQFFSWLPKHIIVAAVILVCAILLPLYYVSTPHIFGEFLAHTAKPEVSLGKVGSTLVGFLQDYKVNELGFLSTSYPDVRRIDDHKFGFFVSVIGVLAFLFLLLLYKHPKLQKFRAFFMSYGLHMLFLSIISVFGVIFGGFFYTPWLYLLVILGISICLLICLINNKHIQLLLIVIVLFGFLHALHPASQNLANIHQEQFMSGNIMSSELTFIKQLPVDGRIMSYGLFDSIIDYGISYLTDHYAARSEHTSLHVWRTPYLKIHTQTSWGEMSYLEPRSGAEIVNYLKAGGYKYVFMNVQHPVGHHVVNKIYPNYTFPIYQNGPVVILGVNDSHYAEKVNVVESVEEEIYKQEDGYKYTALSEHYDWGEHTIEFTDDPQEPEGLAWERRSPEHIVIHGDFEDGDTVLFKEMYISRWKAYMNGQEIPVYTNNHEMVLIRTQEGDRIQLIYGLIPIERAIGILSLIGSVGLLILFIYLLRKR